MKSDLTSTSVFKDPMNLMFTAESKSSNVSPGRNNQNLSKTTRSQTNNFFSPRAQTKNSPFSNTQKHSQDPDNAINEEFPAPTTAFA